MGMAFICYSASFYTFSFDVITAFESVYKIIQVNSHVFCGLIDHRKMASLSPVGDIKMVFPISSSMQNTLTLK